MSSICALTGRKTTFGNNVSFSKRRTSRTYKANIHKHRIWVPELDRHVTLSLSANALRTIDKKGGLVAAFRAQGRDLKDLVQSA